MLAAVICERYGWTWQEYVLQPASFIETIIDMISAEAHEKQKQSRQ